MWACFVVAFNWKMEGKKMLKKIRQKIQRNKNFERNTNIYSKMEGAIERESERESEAEWEERRKKCDAYIWQQLTILARSYLLLFLFGIHRMLCITEHKFSNSKYRNKNNKKNPDSCCRTAAMDVCVERKATLSNVDYDEHSCCSCWWCCWWVALVPLLLLLASRAIPIKVIR